MCLQCGCGKPYDKMGDDDNLTVDDIKAAVRTDNAKGLTTDQAVKNIADTWGKVKDEDKQFAVAASPDEVPLVPDDDDEPRLTM